MREIKFRAWNKNEKRMVDWREIWAISEAEDRRVYLPDFFGAYWYEWMQYTGLHDKNGLTEVYEGDIISPEGDIVSNVYEGKIRQGIDLVIEGMGTKAWRDTEQKAIDRGCYYAE